MRSNRPVEARLRRWDAVPAEPARRPLTFTFLSVRFSQPPTSAKGTVRL
jgi:hypothetical protein